MDASGQTARQGKVFESKEAANTFYYSEEYQAAKAVREACSDTDLMIMEGLPAEA